ncbi:MAG TPA: sigma-70 family RNA polymerase sigma factor [Planctomycetota bacterium]
MTLAPNIEAILAHQDFVQRLARGLVADAASAEDLTQDTWLTYLRQPPRAAAALRSWLANVVQNHARNRHRTDARRVRRERAVARPEAVLADDSRERLELQQRVVAAVLGLAEPYRGVLLLRYYEGLTAAAIAAKSGVPAGTVRSQLVRALDQLRDVLDDQRPEGRAAWLPGLVAIAGRGRALAVGWLAFAGGVCVAALGVATTMALRDDVVPVRSASASSVALVDQPAGAPAVATAVAAEPRVFRTEAPPPQSPGRPADDPALAAMTIAELEAAAAWIQHSLRQRLLVPSPNEVAAELQALGPTSDAGSTRVLRRELAEFRWGTALGVRGGGAYFSFATKSHSYDDEPDLGLEQGNYGCRFYGGTVGLLMPLGDVPLAALHAQRPAQIGAGREDAWQHMWHAADERGLDHAWEQQGLALGLACDTAARPQQTWLLRRASAREHDVLVAFRCVASDEHGHTIVYRTLRTFVASAKVAAGMPEAPRGQPPAWLQGRDAQALLALLADLRTIAEPRLLAVPDEVTAKWPTLMNRDDAGVCRILPRGRFSAIVQSREGAAYFDFIARTHAYERGVHLGLEGDRFLTGFAGNDTGFVLDLGTVSLDAAHDPTVAGPELRDRAVFMRDVQIERDERGAPGLSAGDAKRARALGLESSAVAIAGHTYLLRAVQDHTVLVAFTVVRLDRDGATLAWRLLERVGR